MTHTPDDPDGALTRYAAAYRAIEERGDLLTPSGQGITETTELLAVGRDLKARADDVIGLENAAYDKGRAEAFAEIRRGVEAIGDPVLTVNVEGFSPGKVAYPGLVSRAAVLALLPSVPPAPLRPSGEPEPGGLDVERLREAWPPFQGRARSR